MQISTSIRDYFASMRQRKQDTEFMPEVDGAILEDSPWFTRITVWVVSICLIVALIWANFAVLEEVTTGEGKAIPSSKIQVIQNLEGGIVSEIFVREGQIVEKGAVLLRLDDTRFLSNRGEAEADRLALVARVERLTAEAEGRPISMPADILREAPQLAEDELALYQSRQNRLQSEQRTLGEQLRQKNPGTGRISRQGSAIPLQYGPAAAGAEYVATPGRNRRHFPGGNPPPASQLGGNTRLIGCHQLGDPKSRVGDG